MSQKDSLVSVIVPVYNSAESLPACLDALTDQTCSRLEIILVDDASTDSSLEICRRFASSDERIVLIENDSHSGRGVRLNDGLKISTGGFLGFVDPESTPDSVLFDRLLSMMVEYGADLAVCESRETGSAVYRESKIRILDARRSVREMLCNPKFGMGVWNKLFRAEPFFEAGAFPEDNGRFWNVPLVSRVCMKSGKTAYINQSLYRKPAEPTRKFDESSLELLDAYNLILPELREAFPQMAPEIYEKAFLDVMGLFSKMISERYRSAESYDLLLKKANEYKEFLPICPGNERKKFFLYRQMLRFPYFFTLLARLFPDGNEVLRLCRIFALLLLRQLKYLHCNESCDDKTILGVTHNARIARDT